jgi:cell division protease FtsH
MVREWGMSSRIGPMAWGSQGAVFLGEDLMHTRDYSDDTARVIDEEVERILREQEERGRRVLRQHRKGLDAVAAALLEHETIDGEEVGRLVDDAAGHRVGGSRRLPRSESEPEDTAVVRPPPMAPAPEPNGESADLTPRRPARPSLPRPAEST